MLNIYLVVIFFPHEFQPHPCFTSTSPQPFLMHRKNLLEVDIQVLIGPVVLCVIKIVIEVEELLHGSALKQQRDGVEGVLGVVETVLAFGPFSIS